MNWARRVLLTGATGFAGRAVLDVLVARAQQRVTVVARRETLIPAGVRFCRIDQMGPATDWSDAVKGCDVVIHLAARAHVMRDGFEDSLAEYRKVNVAGTMSLAESAAKAGVKRFLFISSIKVNGDSTLPGKAFTEMDRPEPADPYGVSKAEAEAGLLALAASSQMEVVVIRPPLIYGPGVKANFLSMTRWLARGVPLPLGAVRENRRSFLGLDNFVDLVLKCLDHPAVANQVLIAGDGEDLSTTDLLRRTAAALGVRARLIPVPVPILIAGAGLLGRRDVALRLCGSLQVDISKARRLLGWSPPFSLDEELRRAVAPLRT